MTHKRRLQDAQVTTLPNGLTVITDTVPHLASVYFNAWIKTGSAQDPVGKSGMAHLIEHLLISGGEQEQGKENIRQFFCRMGGSLNAFTEHDATRVEASILDEDLPEALRHVISILKKPGLNSKILKKEKQIIISEIADRLENLECILEDKIQHYAFEGHGYATPIAGRQEEVYSITTKEAVRHWQEHYAPSNICICLCGNISHTEAVAIVESAWNEIPSLKPYLEQKQETGTGNNVSPIFSPRVWYGLDEDMQQVNIGIAWPGTSRHDPDRYASSILQCILGGDMGSRLYEDFREKAALGYEVYTSELSLKDSGLFIVRANVDSKKSLKAAAVIRDQVQNLASTITEKEVQDQIHSILRGTKSVMDEPDGRVYRLGSQFTTYGYVRSMEEIMHGFAQVTKDQVCNLANRIFSQDPVFAALGNVKRLPIPEEMHDWMRQTETNTETTTVSQKCRKKNPPKLDC